MPRRASSSTWRDIIPRLSTGLRRLLQAVGSQPAAALLFACNGRVVGLFGSPDHDARTVRELLGPLPLAGLFCNGEVGPVGAATYRHGFTASLALITAST